jgi:outer membrane lipoprotein SlyB
MNTINTTAARNTHPLVIIAALAVTLFSAVGAAALLGWLPSSTGTPPAVTQPAVAPFAAESRHESASPAARVAEARAQETREPAPRAQPRRVKAPAPVQVAAVEPPPVYAPAPVARAPVAQPPLVVPAPKPVCADCGVVESVRAIEKPGEVGKVGIGSIAGGVLGGVLGHQVGSGRGNDMATVVGAVGGAIAGHQIEKNRNKTTTYDISVRFDDGSTQRFSQAEAPAWRQGDRVRVLNGGLRSL